MRLRVILALSPLCAGCVAAQPPGNFPAGRIQAVYSQLPLHFESDQGQTDPEVEWVARGAGYALWLTPTGAVLALPSAPSAADQGRKAALLRMELVGARAGAVSTGLDLLPSKTHRYASRDPRNWRTGIPNYARVRYAGIYPGIDLIYRGAPGRLEYDFIVAPGADPGRIRLRFTGVDGLEITTAGDLVLKTAAGEVRHQRPRIYQERAAKTIGVPGRFVARGRDEVGFEVGAYDRNHALVIDPVLIYSTYLGGLHLDGAYGVAVDSAGNAYVAGVSASVNFPPPGSYRPSCREYDAYVAKLSSAGVLAWTSTTPNTGALLCGGKEDNLPPVGGVAVDASGNVYVVGTTEAEDFVVTAGALQTTINRDLQIKGPDGTRPLRDAFVVKLNSSGTMVYATYLGGNADDRGYEIAVDSSGNAYVTGMTGSTNFPVVNAYQNASHHAGDAFVAKLNASGTALLYSTYLGGAKYDAGYAIAVDSSGAAYVAGVTRSSDFPTVSALRGSFLAKDIQDAFVAKVSPSGSGLVYSTLLGGSLEDAAQAIAVDSSGNAYVAGWTRSTDFPTAAPLRAVFGGGGVDAFVTKLGSAGNSLVYSTYLGGSGDDTAFGIAVDSSGRAYVAGRTGSGDFPVVDGLSNPTSGLDEAFIAKLNASGGALLYSTKLGGSGEDCARAIAVDSSGDNAYVAGITYSTDFNLVNPQTMGTLGSSEGFAARISACGYGISPQSASYSASGGTGSVAVTASQGCGWTALSGVPWVTVTGGSPGSGNGTVNYSVAANTSGSSRTGTLTIGGQSFQITQAGTGCSYALSATSQSVGASGGPGYTVNVITGSGCAWTAVSNVYWVTITSGSSGSGTGAVVYSVAANGGSARTGTLTIAGQTVQIIQGAGSTNFPPTVDGVTGPTTTGGSSSGAFLSQYSDPNGYTDLRYMYLKVSATGLDTDSCLVLYDRAYNSMWLRDNTNSYYLGPVTPGASGTMENSQCSVSGAYSGQIGWTSTLWWSPWLNFKAAFAGAKNVYLRAQDWTGLDTGWQQKLTWTVGEAEYQVPASVSVTPSTGAGTSQIFSFVYRDPDGYTDLTQAEAILNSIMSGVGACYIRYNRSQNLLYLADDAGSFTGGGLAPGTVGTLQNSQCSLNTGGSSVSGSGTDLTVRPAVTFKTAFGGVKTVYLWARDGWGLESGWKSLGIWLAPSMTNAVAVTVYNTGVVSAGVPAADGAVDGHYRLTSSPDTAYPGPNAIVVNSTGYPIPPWVANDSNSKWIAPRRDAGTPNYNAPGTYVYQTTFDLTGLNPVTTVLVGRWATDNSGTIRLNGVTVGTASNTFDAFTPFLMTNGFVAGVNTLEFVVDNWTTSPSPTGLRVEVSGVAAPASSGTPFTVYSTGVTTPGVPAADGAVDSHYQLVSSPDAAYPGPNAVVINSTGWPIPPWLGNDSNSKWIGPRRDAGASPYNSPGTYTYRTTFDLTGFVPATAALTGKWATDNSGTIKLNGATVGTASSTFDAFTNFTINSGFIAGVNTLEFVVNNWTTSPSPAGLRVEINGSAGPAVNFTLTLSPTSVVGGGSTTANKVTLDSPAPAGGAAVSLSSSDPSVAAPPATVTVAEGATISPNFTITTSGVAATTAVTIQATYVGASRTATVTVNPAALDTLDLTTSSVAGGNSVTANHVHLTGHAPPSGAVVSLTSSNPAVAAVPASVTVAAGASTSPDFTITTVSVASSTPVTITATYAGVSKTATLTVNPTAALSSLTLSPATVVGGWSPSANTVTLTGPAGPGGAVVTLTSSNSSVATPPASVTVAEGATVSPDFTITTSGVAAQTVVTIQATYMGVTKTATLIVNPAALNALHGIPSTVVGGNSLATNHVHLTGDAPPSGAVVSLTSSEPAVAAVPASVTVAAGATTSPDFTITTVYVASSTPVTITATYLGVSKTGTLTVNPPTPNTLHLSPSTVVGGVSTTGNHVHLTGPAGPSGAVVTLTSSNPTVASPPASVTVAAGATTSPNFTITTTQVATTTQVTITATHAGESKTGTLTVNPP